MIKHDVDSANTEDKSNSALAGNLVLVISSLFLCVLFFELGLQLLLGQFNDDGQFSVSGRVIKPYVLPVKTTSNLINQFEKLDSPYRIPDGQLGWTLSPHTTSASGYYSTNAIGLRGPENFELENSSENIRVALFGDSFIHGDDVVYEASLAFFLKQYLRRNNFTAEVMNFGVGAYGNDQAYLRWKTQGRKYKPDVVIIGFQPENCKRNVNIFRVFYSKSSGIPFSKPRFVLDDSEKSGLRLINSPTIAYEKISNEFRNFDTSTLVEHEFFYDEKDYQTSWFNTKIRGYNTFREFVRFKPAADSEQELFSPENDMMILCTRIIEKFVREASLESKVFLLHIPRQRDLQRLLDNYTLDYSKTLAKLDAGFKLIDPVQPLLEYAKQFDLASLFVDHYSKVGNQILAQKVYETLSDHNALFNKIRISDGPQ